MDMVEIEYATFDNGGPVVVTDESEVFERVGLVGVNLCLNHSKNQNFFDSGELERVESNGIRDLEWKELFMRGRPRGWALSELSGFEKVIVVEDGGAEVDLVE